MLMSDGVQFVVGRVLECEQGIVGAWYGQEDLVELALGRALMAGLAVLDDRVRAATTVWKMVSHRAGNPATTLTMIHAAATVTTDTAAGGRDA